MASGALYCRSKLLKYHGVVAHVLKAEACTLHQSVKGHERLQHALCTNWNVTSNLADTSGLSAASNCCSLFTSSRMSMTCDRVNLLELSGVTWHPLHAHVLA
jgi:hypothetical protein